MRGWMEGGREREKELAEGSTNKNTQTTKKISESDMSLLRGARAKTQKRDRGREEGETQQDSTCFIQGLLVWILWNRDGAGGTRTRWHGNGKCNGSQRRLLVENTALLLWLLLLLLLWLLLWLWLWHFAQRLCDCACGKFSGSLQRERERER